MGNGLSVTPEHTSGTVLPWKVLVEQSFNLIFASLDGFCYS